MIEDILCGIFNHNCDHSDGHEGVVVVTPPEDLPPTPVPEPGGVLMFAVGAAVVALAVRKKMK